MRQVNHREREQCTRTPIGVALVGFGLALAGGCASTTSMGTTATSFLIKARESADPNIRHVAFARLADRNCYDSDQQRAEAARFLASKLDEKQEPRISRAVICRTLGELECPEARESLRRACDDPEAVVRAAACRALGKLKHPDDAAVLARIMVADTDDDCRIAAIEGMGGMPRGDARAQWMLVDGMRSPHPAVRLASYEALCRLTGRDMGPNPQAWRKHLESDEGGGSKSSARNTPSAPGDGPDARARMAPK